MHWVNLAWEPSLPGSKVCHTLGTRRAIACLNGRDTNKNKPDAGSRPVPRHRIDPRIDPAPTSSPPATQHPACGMVTSRGYMRGGPCGLLYLSFGLLICMASMGMQPFFHREAKKESL